MAKNKLPAAAPKGVAASDLKRSVKDFLRHKNNASENAGLAGQAKKNAIETYSLDGKAFSLVSGLVKMDDVAKAQSTIRAIMDYTDKLGLLDQVDAFDDLIPTLKRIIARSENQTAPENLGRDGSESHADGEGGDAEEEPADDKTAVPAEGIGAVH